MANIRNSHRGVLQEKVFLKMPQPATLLKKKL